jgi:hypothetical protein
MAVDSTPKRQRWVLALFLVACAAMVYSLAESFRRSSLWSWVITVVLFLGVLYTGLSYFYGPAKRAKWTAQITGGSDWPDRDSTKEPGDMRP